MDKQQLAANILESMVSSEQVPIRVSAEFPTPADVERGIREAVDAALALADYFLNKCPEDKPAKTITKKAT